jgi:hypothetical protein
MNSRSPQSYSSKGLSGETCNAAPADCGEAARRASRPVYASDAVFWHKMSIMGCPTSLRLMPFVAAWLPLTPNLSPTLGRGEPSFRNANYQETGVNTPPRQGTRNNPSSFFSAPQPGRGPPEFSIWTGPMTRESWLVSAPCSFSTRANRAARTDRILLSTRPMCEQRTARAWAGWPIFSIIRSPSPQRGRGWPKAG